MPGTNYIDGLGWKFVLCLMINDFTFLPLIAFIRYVQKWPKLLCCPNTSKKHFNSSTLKKKMQKNLSSSNLLFFPLFMKDDFDVSLLPLVYSANVDTEKR